MRAIPYKTVIRRAVALYLGTAGATGLGERRAAEVLNVHFNKRAAECWEAFPWPEWTDIEKRSFRQAWDALTVYAAAGAERLHRATGRYVVSMQGSTGQEPFSAAGVLNAAYWGELQTGYSASDYASTTAYVRGDKVFYPTTQAYYQLFAATSTGNAPTDTTKWGVLPRFRRFIDREQSWAVADGNMEEIGEFLGCWDDDIELNPAACEVKYVLSGNGMVCDPGAPAEVYVRVRQPVPTWEGDLFVAATNYAADTVVYEDETYGDFFKALDATAGAALSDETKWVRVSFPYVLRDAVAQLIYCDALIGDGMNEKGTLAQGEGMRCLRREFDKIERQQKQHPRLNVKVRL